VPVGLNLVRRTLLRDDVAVTGAEFIRQIRKKAKARHIEVRFEARPGKGSHGRLYYGVRFTTVKDRKKEIGPGLLLKMLTDLGLSRDDMEEDRQ
jgi:mRNA interferase HicA